MTPEGVYRVLQAPILDGTVPPGGQLRGRCIATDLGISRSPLREALTRTSLRGRGPRARMSLTVDWQRTRRPQNR
jgi:DNA-binding FadR family transcriptional regulator